MAPTHPPTPTCHDVCDQVAVEVWCDHDVKLVWPADELHAGVVHNHLRVLNVGVLGSNSLARLRERGGGGGYSVCLWGGVEKSIVKKVL